LNNEWVTEEIRKETKKFLDSNEKEKTQINKIRDEKEDITTDTNKIQKIIWEYFKNLNSSKLENEEIDEHFDTYG
jgi:hypothetical protein